MQKHSLSVQLTVELYEMLEAVNRKVEHLRFMDPISDFLYPFTVSLPVKLLMDSISAVS